MLCNYCVDNMVMEGMDGVGNSGIGDGACRAKAGAAAETPNCIFDILDCIHTWEVRDIDV